MVLCLNLSCVCIMLGIVCSNCICIRSSDTSAGLVWVTCVLGTQEVSFFSQLFNFVAASAWLKQLAKTPYEPTPPNNDSLSLNIMNLLLPTMTLWTSHSLSTPGEVWFFYFSSTFRLGCPSLHQVKFVETSWRNQTSVGAPSDCYVE